MHFINGLVPFFYCFIRYFVIFFIFHKYSLIGSIINLINDVLKCLVLIYLFSEYSAQLVGGVALTGLVFSKSLFLVVERTHMISKNQLSYETEEQSDDCWMIK